MEINNVILYSLIEKENEKDRIIKAFRQALIQKQNDFTYNDDFLETEQEKEEFKNYLLTLQKKYNII